MGFCLMASASKEAQVTDTRSIRSRFSSVALVVACACVWAVEARLASQTRAQDPGVRTGAAAAGAPIDGLTSGQREYFARGQEDFAESEGLADGLGPRMNLDSCGGCHSQPALGGSSPAVNPQYAFATLNGGRDGVP